MVHKNGPVAGIFVSSYSEHQLGAGIRYEERVGLATQHGRLDDFQEKVLWLGSSNLQM